MIRWIRSNGRAQSARQQQSTKTSQPAARPVIAPEPLEGRVLMAAQLSSDSLLNKFSNTPTGNTTTSHEQPALVGPVGGLLEKDDRITNAPKKSLDFTINADISEPRDVDLYKFTTSKKNQRVQFDIDTTVGAPLDSALRLFDHAGNEIAFSDDGAATFEPVVRADSAIDYTFAKTGTYFIGVSASGNDQYNTISGFGDKNASTKGKYKLIVTKLPPPDPNDTIDKAEATETEAFITGNLDWAGDVDMFKFDVLGGTTLSFDVEQDAIIGPGDTILRLFDADGNELDINDDGAAPDEDPAANMFGESYIEHTFDDDGTYYIAVSGSRTTTGVLDKGNNDYDPQSGEDFHPGSIGHYGLRITDSSNY
jgi:hypothetical protein